VHVKPLAGLPVDEMYDGLLAYRELDAAPGLTIWQGGTRGMSPR
jgi:hypothetical protein